MPPDIDAPGLPAADGDAAPITFVIPGQPAAPSSFASATADAAPTRGSVRAAVRVGARRGGGEAVRVSAQPGEDVVVLHIDNGPRLVLHPADAAALMRAQSGGGAARGGALAERVVEVPTQLGWPGLESGVPQRGTARGWLGQVVLKAVEVVSGIGTDRAAQLAAAEVTRRVDAQVRPGVYALKPDALAPLKDGPPPLEQVPAAGGPLLVLLHGTFVDTASTFGKLWQQHPLMVRDLFACYGQVYALDHPTVGTSPIGNALALMRTLPDGAVLHLLTHSRGGLVAEVLARACAVADGAAEQAAIAEIFADAPAASPPLDYAVHRRELAELLALAQAKRVTVQRIVRVACPARGTLLASRRLDAYLSVIAWLLERAGVPLLPELLGFLDEVARRRARPGELPGIEAMTPGSALVRWLHAVEQPIAGQLRVVAGDLDGDSLGSWLKTLLSDAFYWTDHDLVVQTRSMYGGAPRRDEATFLLARGGTVSHFTYFSNEATAQGCVQALLQAAPPRGFFTIGLMSWRGDSAEGVRGGRVPRGGVLEAAQRPAVFVLPGILGTHLKADGQRIWLGWRIVNGLGKLAWQGGTTVQPDGPVGLAYDELIGHLGDSHEVIPFGYDWREPIEDEARRLAAALEQAMAARTASGQPVRIVAHSMGGLLARAVQLVRPEVWERLLAHPRGRLLMLGTPNAGSWAPMQVLSGDDTLGNALASFGALFQDEAARRVMAGFPGFLQLQAGLLDPALALDREATWQRLAQEDLKRVQERSDWHREIEQITPYRWGVPPQAVLDAAVALRRRFDAQRDVLAPLANKLLLVVGKEKFTPAGFEMGDSGLSYLNAPQAGDGRVTFDSACLPGVRTWQVECSHGDLAAKASAFDAYVELLEGGDTRALPEVSAGGPTRAPARPAAAALAPLQPSRPSRGAADGALPPGDARQVLTGTPPAEPPLSGAPAAQALQLAVVNGNLRFVQEPLLVGHYRSMALAGSEGVMDRLLHGALSEAIKAGLYPDGVGAHQVFINSWSDPDNPLQMPRPQAVVVIGLGEEGKLPAGELARTVRQATIAYAQRVAEVRGGGEASFTLATTLIGSGGTGITPGTSAQVVAQGVREANERLARCGWPRVSKLIFVELYLDRASEAWRALDILRQADASAYALEEGIHPGTGPLTRPLESGYRGASYDFITAVSHVNAEGELAIEYSLDTRRARTEVRAQQAQTALIRELVCVAADDRNHNEPFGRTLFHLLVPRELEPFLVSSGDIVLELDTETASYPWELMDVRDRDGNAGRHVPWAIRARLLRKLRTPDFREQPVAAGRDGGVLVIGEPVCDASQYPPLPGARAEAQAVATTLKTQTVLLGADALGIVNTLLDNRYRVVHIAGHGEYRKDGGGGVVLSNNTVLGPREIKSMRIVPELVFVNCCHLGAIEALADGRGPRGLGRQRAAFAANVAEELIRLGVRCVVAAGWAVDDEPAALFATRFYESLLRGQRFIDAIAEAREATWKAHPESNTWAAYQCYGDPDWAYVDDDAVAASSVGMPTQHDPLDGIQSAYGLQLALQSLATESRYGDRPRERQADQLRALESRLGARWGTQGAVAEAYADAHGELGDFPAAIGWYQRALAAEDGGASWRAAEQLANLQARQAVDGLPADDPLPAAAAEAALQGLQQATASLHALCVMQRTVERRSLLGSAHKRMAMLQARRGDTAAWRAAVQAMGESYADAEALGRAQQAANWYYPALNALAAELLLAEAPAPLSPQRLAALRQAIAAQHERAPDFWSATQAIELALYEALAAGALAPALPALLERFDDLKARVASPKLWASVRDQARFSLQRLAAGGEGDEAAAAAQLLQRLQQHAAP